MEPCGRGMEPTAALSEPWLQPVTAGPEPATLALKPEPQHHWNVGNSHWLSALAFMSPEGDRAQPLLVAPENILSDLLGFNDSILTSYRNLRCKCNSIEYAILKICWGPPSYVQCLLLINEEPNFCVHVSFTGVPDEF
ncbi:hypothetical protein UY3_16215 [Chelonia mydas]|uniref:Uncharacterized protein n=1 Tax=Chelonia mydas TaxID=8469 RepID=M7AUQ4_CHEMY|nr:hypothetical protein UY3_16215 [Chelonia mydas]